jgi:hypothetical protein
VILRDSIWCEIFTQSDRRFSYPARRDFGDRDGSFFILAGREQTELSENDQLISSVKANVESLIS